MNATEKTTLFLIDDHEAIIEGITNYLETNGDYRIVGHALDGASALERIKSLNPDIVILDIFIPGPSGIDLLFDLRNADVSSKIIVYTMSSEREHILRMFNAGISGYVLKDDPFEDLILAIEAAKANSSFYSKIVENTVREHMRELELGHMDEEISKLTDREKELLPLLADGKSVREIATTFHISPKTVETHKYNLMEKLNVDSLTELTKLAIRKKLIRA